MDSEDSMLLRDADMVLFVSVAFPKDLPHEAHPRQGIAPEPVSAGSFSKGRRSEGIETCGQPHPPVVPPEVGH